MEKQELLKSCIHHCALGKFPETWGWMLRFVAIVMKLIALMLRSGVDRCREELYSPLNDQFINGHDVMLKFR